MSDDAGDWFERALRDDDGEDGDGGDRRGARAAGLVPSSARPEAGEGPDDPFAMDFATALAGAPLPSGASEDADALTGWGIDAPSEREADTFEDEEYESDLPRIDVGVEGLDAMIQGGIPERSLMVAIGDAGAGKTTLGLQFLRHGLVNGENAVFIALEESHDRVLNTADEKGWEFSDYVERDRLAIVDLDPVEMANSLTSIRNELPALVREFRASRLVLDSVSLLEMMYSDQAIRRNEIYDFTQSLKRAGVTTMLTSEASETDPYHSRFGIIEYLTDAVFVLRYIRADDFRETRLAVEIQKIRDANHSREMKPFEITSEGISVYRQANIF